MYRHTCINPIRITLFDNIYNCDTTVVSAILWVILVTLAPLAYENASVITAIGIAANTIRLYSFLSEVFVSSSLLPIDVRVTYPVLITTRVSDDIPSAWAIDISSAA